MTGQRYFPAAWQRRVPVVHFLHRMSDARPGSVCQLLSSSRTPPGSVRIRNRSRKDFYFQLFHQIQQTPACGVPNPKTNQEHPRNTAPDMILPPASHPQGPVPFLHFRRRLRLYHEAGMQPSEGWILGLPRSGCFSSQAGSILQCSQRHQESEPRSRCHTDLCAPVDHLLGIITDNLIESLQFN